MTPISTLGRRRETILLVDEDDTLAPILRANLEVSGYDVVAADGAQSALCALDARVPDAVVLDVLIGRRDGSRLVRTIRSHPRGANVPVIVLAPPPDADSAVNAFEAGADDVLVKPFAPEEMLARVRGKIERARAGASIQPLTKLPANGSIQREIERRLQAGTPWSILYCDLDGFKAFNDAFGFAKGDQVIKLLADVIVGATRRDGESSDFVGHVGGDDFVVITTPARADAIAHAIVAGLDRGVRRVQQDTRVPYCTVSVAVLSGSGAASYEDVAERAAAVKKEAKRRPGSAVVTESELG